jgi:hypothetical protein
MSGIPKRFVVLAAVLLASATARPVPAADKWPVPDQKAQRRSADLVRETYKEKFAAATDAAKQGELAAELILKAEETKDNPPLCFALFDEATTLAAGTGNISWAMDTIDEMEWRFRFHGTQRRLQAFRTIAQGTTLPRGLVAQAASAAQEAIETDEVDAAVEFCDLAVEVAGKAANPELKAATDEYASLVKQYAARRKAAGGEPPTGEMRPQLATRKNGGGFGDRGPDARKTMLAAYGGTRQTERAVAGALLWLGNHQNADGSWSLQKYTQHCHDQTCTGPGSVHADAGATAMGLLPFLGAGQTHKTRGTYRGNITAAINWLVRHQQKDGNLAKDCDEPMYSHGLATMALCDAYGLTADRNIGMAAQGAVNYIINAQNQADGGWRYHPGEDGDTSVTGWQIMALKSAAMAGLGTGPVFGGASKWLDSVQSGPNNSLYAYQPGQGSSNTMTAVGLLCRQCLGGTKRDNPMMADGVKYLMNNLPDAQMPNIYYWYYATPVLFNAGGRPWDQWNRKMRQILLDTQCHDTRTCANGSWDPSADLWGQRGGRIMQTSLAALILEVYYRYPPVGGE